MEEFASGAKSTEVKPRYDLVPLAAEKAIANRLGLGAEHHGERNYLKGSEDPVFRRDRLSHTFEHLRNYIEGNVTEDKYGDFDHPIDHLEAAITGLAMELHMTEKAGTLGELEERLRQQTAAPTQASLLDRLRSLLTPSQPTE